MCVCTFVHMYLCMWLCVQECECRGGEDRLCRALWTIVRMQALLRGRQKLLEDFGEIQHNFLFLIVVKHT